MPVDDKRRKTALIATRNYINNAKDIIDVGVAVIGKLHPAAAFVCGLAFAVKSLISVYGPDEANDVMEELKNLRKKADDILEHMSSQFTAFRAFYFENHFWNEVPLRTSVLYQYMQEVRANPSKDNMDEFRHQYEKHDPVELARRLNNQLQRDVMNPMEQAAKSEKLMTDETFKKWYDLIGHVFKQLWEIEICAGVWIHDQSQAGEADEDPRKERLRLEEKLEKMDRVNDMVNEIDIFRNRIEQWEDEYEQKIKFWPDEVEKIVKKSLESDKDGYLSQAKSIAEDLEKFHRRTEMYVMVVRNTSLYSVYPLYENAMRQVLEVKGDRHTAIIYRSREAHKMSELQLKRAFTDVKVFHEQLQKASVSGSEENKYIDYFKKQAASHAATFRAKGCGVLVFVDSNHKHSSVQTNWPNSTKTIGCGHIVNGFKMDSQDGKTLTDFDMLFCLFAGYK